MYIGLRAEFCWARFLTSHKARRTSATDIPDMAEVMTRFFDLDRLVGSADDALDMVFIFDRTKGAFDCVNAGCIGVYKMSFSISTAIEAMPEEYRPGMIERFHDLVETLDHDYHYELRDDSRLVWSFITGQLDASWTKQRIIHELCLTKYIHDYTNYAQKFKATIPSMKSVIQHQVFANFASHHAEQLAFQYVQRYVIPLFRIKAMMEKHTDEMYPTVWPWQAQDDEEQNDHDQLENEPNNNDEEEDDQHEKEDEDQNEEEEDEDEEDDNHNEDEDDQNEEEDEDEEEDDDQNEEEEDEDEEEDDDQNEDEDEEEEEDEHEEQEQSDHGEEEEQKVLHTYAQIYAASKGPTKGIR